MADRRDILRNLFRMLRASSQERGPVLLPIPTQPLPIKENLGAMTGLTGQQEQQALQLHRMHVGRIQAQNQRILDRHAEEQQQAQQSMIGGGLSQAAGGASALLSPTPSLGSFLGGASHLLGGVGAAAGAAVGSPGLGAAAAGLGAFGAAIVEVIEKLKNLAFNLSGGQLMGQVSGPMAQVKAMQQVNDILFAKQVGDALAPSEQAKNEAYNRMRQSLKGPIIGTQKQYNEAEQGLFEMGEDIGNFSQGKLPDAQRVRDRTVSFFEKTNLQNVGGPAGTAYYLLKAIQIIGRAGRHAGLP